VNTPTLPDQLTPLTSVLLPLDSESIHSGRPSAVLVLLFQRHAGVQLLLTARPVNLPRHAGQISLPGGSYEPGDDDLWRTALRETHEELGVDTQAVLPLDRLVSLPMRISDFVISPFVGWIDPLPQLHPDPSEVQEVIEIELNAIIDENLVETEVWERRGERWSITFYRFGAHVVWGATARILHDLASRIDPSLLQVEPAPGSVLPFEA
jgi:8-oxo-dGTP pyrophosphatase MutT (NUDIX family)